MNKRAMNDQQKAIADYLESIGVSFSVVLVGPTKRDDWECDQWVPMFKREGKADFTTPYFTGTGHRKSARPMPPDIARLNPRILARVEWEKANLKPVAPFAADVLYSVVLDAQGAGQNFHDWCADLGYNNDSIKAFQTYQACCEILAKVRKFFSVEERQKLSELLEGY